MEILRRVNEFRKKRGRSELFESTNMNMVATTRALEMADGRQPLSHRHKNKKRGYVVEMLPEEKRVELIYASNARSFSPFTDQQHAALVVSMWEKSQSHLEGLLDADVKGVGFGVAEDGNTAVVVAVFTNKT